MPLPVLHRRVRSGDVRRLLARVRAREEDPVRRKARLRLAPRNYLALLSF